MKNICSVCGKEFEKNEFNSYLDDENPICDECLEENNKRIIQKKLIKTKIKK